MQAADVLQLLTTLGCQVCAQGETLQVQDPHHALTDALRQAIRTHKATLLAFLTSTVGAPDARPRRASAQGEQAYSAPTPGENAVRRREDEDAPSHYWSEMVQADFWVCETASQAATLRAQGQVAYLPKEIWHLRDLKARDPATFTAKLRAIHQAKKVFGGTLDVLEQVTGADGALLSRESLTPATPVAPRGAGGRSMAQRSAQPAILPRRQRGWNGSMAILLSKEMRCS